MSILVGTGGFERRFAYTLPAFTGTHNAVLTFRQWDFPAAAIDGGADSFLNGGGDFRACLNSDGTGELPTHIVRFVIGGSPNIEVKVYVPGAYTGQTIYFFGKKAGAVAYGVTEQFGRNAVFQDYHAYLPLNDLSFTDVTGNGHDGVATGAVTLGNNNAYFGVNSKSFITLNNSVALVSNADYTLQIDSYSLNTNTYGGIFGNWATTDSNGTAALTVHPTDGYRFFSKNPGAPSQSVVKLGEPRTAGVFKKLSLSSDGTNIRGWVDDTFIGSWAHPAFISNATDSYLIGTYYDKSSTVWDFEGHLKNARISKYALTQERISLEHDNESNTGSSWGTVGALEDTTSGEPEELSLMLQGIAADEAIGQPQLSAGAVSLQPSPILSEDSTGEPSLLVADHTLTLSAIDSTSSVGSQVVTPAAVTLEPVGISNPDVVGSPVFTQDGAPGQSVNVEAIETNAQVGLPAVTPIAVSVELAGVTSTSAVGEPLLNAAQILTPSGIESAEAVSSPVLDAGAVDLAPSSINELTAVGEPSVISENQTLQLIGMNNSSTVGVPRIGEMVTQRPIACLDLVIAREALALSVLKSTLDIQIHRACR